jgi:phosphonate transport system substrate-binding protein
MCKKALYLLSSFLFIVFVAGCGEKEKPSKISIQKKITDAAKNETEDHLFFGVSASESPQSIYRKYNSMVSYLEHKTERQVKLVQRRTYSELNGLFKEKKVDFAWLAAGAYVSISKDLNTDVLALPSKGGKPNYYSYIIVRSDSPVSKFDELSGKPFAFVDPLSCSGYYYPAYVLSEKGSGPDSFFSRTVFSGGHDRSIGLVLNKEVDGASVSSIILHKMQENSHDVERFAKVIQVSDSLTMGPIVAQKGMSVDLKERLKEILLNMHLQEDGKAALRNMGINGFMPGSDLDYTATRKMVKIAEGIPTR